MAGDARWNFRPVLLPFQVRRRWAGLARRLVPAALRRLPRRRTWGTLYVGSYLAFFVVLVAGAVDGAVHGEPPAEATRGWDAGVTILRMLWIGALAAGLAGAGFAWHRFAGAEPGAAAVAQPGALPPLPDGYVSDTTRLRPLGEAYAGHYALTLRRVSLGAPEPIVDAAAAAARLEDALRIAYLPTPGVLLTFAAADAAEVMRIEMAGGRSPAEVVRDVAAQGNVLVPVLWEFAEGEPAHGYAVFTAENELLFESLLSMPAVQGRVFSLGH